MLRIGGTASPGHITVFRDLKTHFQQQGIALDWVLYADYNALVEAFATREIDLAWNGPNLVRPHQTAPERSLSRRGDAGCRRQLQHPIVHQARLDITTLKT